MKMHSFTSVLVFSALSIACSEQRICGTPAITLNTALYDRASSPMGYQNPGDEIITCSEAEQRIKAALTQTMEHNISNAASYSPSCEGEFVATTASAADPRANQSETPRYTGTNNQVPGVDEGDRVKTDGSRFFVLSNRSILVIDGWPADQARILHRETLSGTPLTLHWDGQSRRLTAALSNEIEKSIEFHTYQLNEAGTLQRLRVDSLPGTSIKKSAQVGGRIRGVVTDYLNYPDGVSWVANSEEKKAELVSRNAAQIESQNLKLCSNPNTSVRWNPAYGSSIARVFDLNLDEGTLEWALEPSMPDSVLITRESLYTASDSWSGRASIQRYLNVKGDQAPSHIRLSGRLVNSFAMDEYAGNFRVAVTESLSQTNASRIETFTIAQNTFERLGQSQELAPGEQIYSVRFDGLRAYVVTFRTVDPLFVINLEDVSKPVVVGELKIPGYSTYLHPTSLHQLIGIGREGNALKVSLFDVEMKPRETDSYQMQNRYSEAEWNHLAFKYFEHKELLAIPTSWNSVDLFSINAEAGIRPLLTIPMPLGSGAPDTYSPACVAPMSFLGSVFIQNHLYVFSETGMSIVDTQVPAVTSQILF